MLSGSRMNGKWLSVNSSGSEFFVTHVMFDGHRHQAFFFSGISRENNTAIMKANMKLASLSEMPVCASKKFFQITVDTVPDIREANIPAREKRFQKSNSNNAGPNDEPIPDQA